MQRSFCLAALLLLHVALFAQHSVTFRINKLPDYHSSNDSIYLVGSFNGWNPADSNLLLANAAGNYTIKVLFAEGSHEYKFTKGSWDKVESHNNGFPTENRRLFADRDTVILIEIEHWADHFPKKKVESTAGKNVSLLDSAFYIPQLQRFRRVRLYLPDGYNESDKHYPVLYLQDGQNVFDNATSGFGEWGIDEALDTLGLQHKEIIVVAIDHGGSKRINEYAPFDMENYGRGEGDAYVDFLKKTLKPYIDKRFRTKKGKENTFIAGSSMGGLISFYAILKYPKVFGGAGVFSPAFWINPELKNVKRKKAKKVKGKIYFFGGMLENEHMVPDMLAAFEQMKKYSKADMKVVIRADGKHNEATWREEFPKFYKWIMAED